MQDRVLRLSPSARILLELALLLVAALFCYGWSLNGPFVWDDEWLALENPFIKSPLFVLEVFRQYLFLDSLSAYYRPVQNLSYMLDYWAWGEQPFGFHLTNVLLHAGVALLLCQLLKRLLRSEREWVALAVSLLWVVHPIHNAAVAYISGRADALASFFAIAGWLLYLRAGDQQRCKRLYSAAAMAAMFLALCSKEIAIVWVALFLVHGLFFGGIAGRKLPTLLALGAVGAFYAWLRFSVGERQGLSGPEEPLALRLLLMLRALGDYSWLIFFPDNLRMERLVYLKHAYATSELWHANIRLEYLSVIGLLTVLCFLWGCASARPGQSLRRLGAVWFVIGFVPISNLFPLNAQAAEHWIYMPSIGFLLFVAGCWRGLRIPGHPTAVLVGMAVVALSVRTAIRSADWAEPERFFKKTIEAGGGTPRVWLNLAHFYARNNRLVEAAEVLSRTLERFPNHRTAQINLGLVLIRQGKADEGEKLLQAASANDSEFAQSWRASLKLAHQHSLRGEKERAKSVLDAAIAKNSAAWELVKLRAGLSDPAVAVDMVGRYLEKNWWHYPARMELGHLQLASQNPEAACKSWEKAAWLDIRKEEAYRLIAQAELQQSRPELALAAQLKALKRNPHTPSQYLFLAKIYEQLGSHELAAKASERARKLRTSVSGEFRHF